MVTSTKLNSAEPDFRAVGLYIDDDCISVQLSDGREIKVPLEFYPKLKNANQSDRQQFELIGMGTGIHWPILDEDLSVAGIVMGYMGR